jgi:2-dehydropantoate 2-reductase
MHILIFGSGAVGGYLGTVLALAGVQVTFLCRPKLAQVLRAQGLRLSTARGSTSLRQPHVIETLKDLESLPDAAFITVKVYDVPSAAQALREHLPDIQALVCFTNGIGGEAMLGRHFPHERVIAATLTSAVVIEEPAHLRVTRERGVGLAGDHPACPQLLASFQRAGLKARHYQDPRRMKWSKLLTNMVANAVSAITGLSPAQLYDHPGFFRLELEALREALGVMRAMGLRPQNLPSVPVGLMGTALFLPPRLIQPVLRRMVAGGRGEKLPSFHYDLGRGRSEVKWLNGAVVEAGTRLDLPTPANALISDRMWRLASGELDPQTYRADPQRLLREAEQEGVPGIRGYNPLGDQKQP